MKSVRIKAAIHWVPEVNVATFAMPEPVRIVLLVDATASDFFLTSDDERPFAPGGLNALQNLNTFGKYTILKDMWVHPPAWGNNYGGATSADATYGGSFKQIKFHHKWKNGLECNYNANVANDIRQLDHNALHLMVWTGNYNQVGVEFNYQCRVTFSDL